MSRLTRKEAAFMLFAYIVVGWASMLGLIYAATKIIGALR